MLLANKFLFCIRVKSEDSTYCIFSKFGSFMAQIGNMFGPHSNACLRLIQMSFEFSNLSFEIFVFLNGYPHIFGAVFS